MAPVKSPVLVGFVILGDSCTKSDHLYRGFCRSLILIHHIDSYYMYLHVVSQGWLFTGDIAFQRFFNFTTERKCRDSRISNASSQKKIHGCTFSIVLPSWPSKSLPKSTCIGPGCTKEGSRKPGPGIVGMSQKRGGLSED